MDNNKSIETLVKTETIRKRVVSVDASKDEKVKTITMTDGPLIPKKGEKHLMTSWRITFFIALALLLGLVIFKPFSFKR